MKIHELKLEAKADRKRVGRGIGSGTGKTAGRGTKGQNARTGGGVRPGFEGGQNPLYRRLPKKRGFKPYSQIKFQVVNVSSLEKLGKASVDAKILIEAGLIRDNDQPIKLLGDGEIRKAVTVKLQAATKSATAKIQKAGGKVELLK